MTDYTRTFTIDRTFAGLSKWASWLLIGFAFLFVTLPFLPDGDRPSNQLGIIVLSVLGVCFFGLLGSYGFRIAKQLPYCSVSVDGDGLWPAHLPKVTTLIRWKEIHAVRERVYLQRLDLLDSKGKLLIKLEYQLSGFEALRALLLEKARRPTVLVAETVFTKKPIYHTFYVLCISGFTLLGWYVGRFNPVLGYGGMAIVVALIAHEYLTTVSRFVLLPDRIQLGFPFQTREIFRAEIEAIQIGDLYVKGARHPEVGLFIRDQKKPIQLRSLGADAVNLQQILEQWRMNTF